MESTRAFTSNPRDIYTSIVVDLTAIGCSVVMRGILPLHPAGQQNNIFYFSMRGSWVSHSQGLAPDDIFLGQNGFAKRTLMSCLYRIRVALPFFRCLTSKLISTPPHLSSSHDGTFFYTEKEGEVSCPSWYASGAGICLSCLAKCRPSMPFDDRPFQARHYEWVGTPVQ